MYILSEKSIMPQPLFLINKTYGVELPTLTEILLLKIIKPKTKSNNFTYVYKNLKNGLEYTQDCSEVQTNAFDDKITAENFYKEVLILTIEKFNIQIKQNEKTINEIESILKSL